MTTSPTNQRVPLGFGAASCVRLDAHILNRTVRCSCFVFPAESVALILILVLTLFRRLSALHTATKAFRRSFSRSRTLVPGTAGAETVGNL
jgi:hypothetical protein